MGTLRGLVVQEESLVLTWTGTPVGPLPGEVLEADGQTSEASWTTSGTILGATSPALDLRVARAGLPGDAQILWREDGGSHYYGWDALHVAHHLRRLADTGDAWRASSAIRLADGTALAALSRGDEGISVWRSADPDNRIQVYSRSAPLPAGELHAALLQLPSGRVLLLHWLVRDGTLQIRAWRSDDSGATWSLHQRAVLAAGLDTATYTPYRLRAAVVGDAVLLLAHVLHSAPQDRIVQWASSDGGASFVQIVEWDGQARGWPEILVSGGRAVVVYLAYRSASAPNVLPYRRALASAYESIADADSAAAVDVADFEWGTYSGGEITTGELAALEDGETLWIYGQNHEGGHSREIHAAISRDGGDSWTVAGSSAAGIEAGRVWAGGSSSVYPADLVAAPWLGGAILLHRWQGGDDPDGLFGLEVGGYRGLTLPAAEEGDDTPEDQTSWTRTWLPAAEPDALDAATWTEVLSGSPSVTVDGAELEIVSGSAGHAVNWNAAPTTSLARGLLVEADVTPGTAKAFVDVAVGSGSDRYYVRASWDGASTWTLRDMIGSSDLGIVSTTGSSATRHRLLIALDSGGALLQVSEVLEDDAGEDGGEIGRVTGTPAGSGAAGTDLVSFGMLTGSLSGQRCAWHGIAWAEGTDTGDGLSGGQTLSERQGRPVSAIPVWIARGLHLAATGGVAGVGERWSVASRYRYDGSHSDPSVAPSVRVPARWTAAPTLTWTWSDSLARTPLALPALYLERFNFRRAILEYRDSSGTWQSLGLLDLALASGLGWRRTGASIRANAAGSSSKRISTESLVGGYLVHAVPLGTDRVWPIRHNNGGRFNDGSTSGQLARFDVAGALSGDPTSGTTGAILPPRVLIVLPPSLLSTPFRALRLSPSSNGAAAEDADSGEAYYQIGSALMGLLYPFGRQYSHGRVSEVASAGEVTRGLSGAVLAARRRGEARYAAEFSWSDAQDEYPLALGTIPVEGVYGHALATPAAVLPDLQGVIERCGQDVPVVYVAALTLASETDPTVHHGDRRDLLRGLISSEVFRLDTVWGEEGGGEVRRGGTLRVEEVG